MDREREPSATLWWPVKALIVLLGGAAVGVVSFQVAFTLSFADVPFGVDAGFFVLLGLVAVLVHARLLVGCIGVRLLWTGPHVQGAFTAISLLVIGAVIGVLVRGLRALAGPARTAR